MSCFATIPVSLCFGISILLTVRISHKRHDNTGHGGKVKDRDGDEKDGYDETLVPLDYGRAGQIRDDDLYKILVRPLKEGVFATCIMDCCHSGSVLDLPYTFVADGEQEEMTLSEDFDFGPLLSMAAAFLASPQGAQMAAAVFSACGACTIM